MKRKRDLGRFYEMLRKLENKVRCKRKLENCDGYMKWPERGVYFFFESDGLRESGGFLRITRIGTYAVPEGSKTSFYE